MGWRDEVLVDIADAAKQEFGETITHVPQLREARGRPGDDPNRPQYDFQGWFDPNLEGGFSHTARLSPPNSLEQTKFPSQQPVLFAKAEDLTYPPNEADAFIIDGVTYRVLHIGYSMPGVHRILLEQMGRPGLA